MSNLNLCSKKQKITELSEYKNENVQSKGPKTGLIAISRLSRLFCSMAPFIYVHSAICSLQ